MKKVFKKSILITFLTLLFIIAAVFAVSHTTVASAQKLSDRVPTEKVPIERALLTANCAGQIRPKDTVNFRVELTPLYAIETADSVEYFLTEGNELVVKNGSSMTIKEDAAIGHSITVQAIADGVKSNTLNFTIVETPVSQLQILNTETKLQQNRTMQINTRVLPADSTNSKVRYSIVNGGQYATVSQSGVLTAHNNLPDGNLSVTIRAESLSNSNVYDEKTFLLYVPTRNLAITVSNQNPVCGESIELQADIDPTASMGGEIFTVRAQDRKYVKSLVGNVLTVSDDVTDFNPSITVHCSRDGISAEKQIEIYIKATALSIDAHSPFIKQGGMEQFTIIPTPLNATLKNLKYSLADENNATITADGLLKAKILPQKTSETVEVIASLDEVSISTFVTVVRPNVILTANRYEPTTGSASAQTVTFAVEVDGATQVDDLHYIIKKGANFVQGGVITNGVLTLKKGITEFDPEIVIAVSYGTWESNEIVVRPQVSVEAVTIKNSSVTQVEQLRDYSFGGVCLPSNAAKAKDALIYKLNVGPNIAAISESGVLSVKQGAPVGTKIIITVHAPDGISATHTVTVKTVYAAELRLDRVTDQNGIEVLNYATVNPGDVLNFSASFPDPNNVTDSQKTYEVSFHSGTNLAVFDGHSAKIKNQNKISDNNPYVTFKVTSNQNGETLIQYFTVYVHISVTHIAYTQYADQVSEGDRILISKLVTAVAMPYNSNVREVVYTVTGNARRVGNYIEVDKNLTSGHLKFNITMTAENASPVSLEFAIFVAPKSIGFAADKYDPMTQERGGESVVLTVTKDTSATQDMTVRIVKGANLIVGNYSNNGYLTLQYNSNGVAKFSFTVKSSANIGADKLIQFEAVQGALKKTVDINIYKPIETWTIDGKSPGATILFDRDVEKTLSLSFTGNASETDKWTVSKPDMLKNPLIDITNRTSPIIKPVYVAAGTKYSVTFSTNDRLNKTFTFIFQVDKLDESKFTFDFPGNSGSKNPYVVDSNGEQIDATKPQLWVGRSTDITLTYNGFPFKKYGIKIADSNGVGFFGGSAYADMIRMSDNIAQLIIKTDASGKVFVQPQILIQDGTEICTVNLKPIAVFRPMSGAPVLTNGTIVASSTQLKLADGNFDPLATCGLSSLLFYGSNLSGVTLTNGGLMSITADSANASQNIFLRSEKPDGTCTQKYNGNDVLFEAELTQSIHRMNVFNINGDNTFTICAVNGRSTTVSVPFREGYIFEGYYTGHYKYVYTMGYISGTVLVYDTQYYDSYGKLKVTHSNHASELSIYAKWTHVRSIQELTKENTIVDTNDYSYVDYVNPDFDMSSLKNLGYKNIKISIAFSAKEVHDGYQDIRIYSGRDSTRIGAQTIEHGPGKKDTSWRSHTVTYTILIESFDMNNGFFYIGWGAHGAFEDNWVLGNRIITVEAQK